MDAVIIIDGDDPLFFKNLIKNQIILFKKKMYDMIYYKTKHVGISCYLIKTSILKKIINKKNKRNTEVWAHYFLKQKKINKKMINFNLKYFKDPLRLTLDYKEDFKLIKKIINFLDNKTDFSDKNLIQSLRYNKELLNINSGMVKKWEKHLKLST